MKLLYDIYHMQIMEGDLIKTIRDQHDFIAHYHTGGVPGRHELDGTQEVNWPAVCRAIVDTGFSGYLAHEFVPTRDPLTSLAKPLRSVMCDARSCSLSISAVLAGFAFPDYSRGIDSPPSTLMIVPVAYGTSPRTSAATARPTSSGWPQRRSGTRPSAMRRS